MTVGELKILLDDHDKNRDVKIDVVDLDPVEIDPERIEWSDRANAVVINVT